MANKTAFVLSERIAGAADGVSIPGVPGLWSHDVAMLPGAIGYTLEEMRDAIKLLGLPLDEVSVPESKAYDLFPEDLNKMPSSRETPGAALTLPEEGPAPEVELVTEPDPATLDETVERALEAEEEQG